MSEDKKSRGKTEIATNKERPFRESIDFVEKPDRNGAFDVTNTFSPPPPPKKDNDGR